MDDDSCQPAQEMPDRPVPDAPATPDAQPASSADFRVLLVDDEPALCNALQRLLARYGFRARVEPTRLGALAAVREEAFDALVLDYWLAWDDARRGTGVELHAEMLIEDPELAARAVFMTGDPSELPHATMLAHSTAILQKPFAVGLLVDVLRAVVAAKGRRAERPSVEVRRVGRLA